MQIYVTSNDLTLFSVVVTMDLQNSQMKFDISATEFSNSPAGSGCSVAFGVRDQSASWLTGVDWVNDFSSVFDSPQIPDCSTQSEYDLSIYGHYSFLFQEYRIYAAIKDSNGNIYQLQFPVKKVCKPTDFTDDGYVYGLFDVRVDCTNQLLTVTELTNLTYNDVEPTTVTKNGTLYYPRGTVSDLPFSATPFTDNRVYTGTYTINCTTTATYDLDDGFFVQVLYVTDNVDFPARCGNVMAQVLCCVDEVYKRWKTNCNNAVGKQAKDMLWEAMIPMLEGTWLEQRGLDASLQVKQIADILDCDCNCNGVKKVEAAPVDPTVYNIVITGSGDVTVSSVTVGNTKTYTVISKVYSVGKGNPSDLGWSITVDTSIANTVIYKLTFDYATIANYILTAIGNSSTLLTQFNSLVLSTGSNIDLSNLDGKCIIDLSSVNYFLTYRVPTVATTVTNIIIGSTTYNAPSSLLVTDIAGIEAWLNGLGLGTFQASFSSTNGAFYSSILTNNNPNNPVSVTYTTISGDVTIAFTKTNKSLIAFLQAVVDYLCNLTTLQVSLGQALSLCSLDYNDEVVTTSYGSDTLLSDFMAAQATVICDIINKISDLEGVTCAKLKDIFTDNASAVFGSNDRFLTFMGGLCTGATMSQAALAIIKAINADATVKAAFCAIDCTSPATCPDISNINASALSSTSIGIYGVTWTPANPSATQTATVKYRVTGTSSWTTATNALQLFPNGNVVVSSPYTISGLSAAMQYDIFIQNNCGGVGFIKQVTTPTGTIYTTSVQLDTDIYNVCGNTPANVYSNAPLTTGVIAYTDIGLTTPVSGYDYLVIVSTGEIYTIDNATGEILTDTGLNCGTGTAGTYILGNDSGTICSNSDTTLYTNGAFAVLGFIYNDSGLTSPVTGYAFVVDTLTNKIYNVDNATGQILSDTGLTCSSVTVRLTSSIGGANITGVTGISGFTPTPAFPLAAGGTITGTHAAFTGAINFTMSGSLPITPCNAALYINGVLRQCININSITSYSFSSDTYLATEVVQISFGLGSC